MALAKARCLELIVSSSGSNDEITVAPDGSDTLIQNTVGEIQIKNTQSNKSIVFNVNDGGADTRILDLDAANAAVKTGATDAYRIEANPTTNVFIYSNTGASFQLSTRVYSNTAADQCYEYYTRYRGTETTPLTIATGDYIGTSLYYGYDGTASRSLARIQCRNDTVTGTDNLSASLTFATRNDGAAAALTTRLTIGKQGNITALAPYSTVIGGTNVDLYIDNTGLMGPAPSSLRYKENIKLIESKGTSWVLSVPIKSFNFKGNVREQIGIIAEDLDKIHPAAVRYETYQVVDRELKKIDRGQLQFLKTEERIPRNKTVKEKVIRKATVITKDKKKNDAETVKEEEIEMEVRRIPEGILKDQIIFALVSEVQKLAARVMKLEEAK